MKQLFMPSVYVYTFVAIVICFLLPQMTLAQMPNLNPPALSNPLSSTVINATVYTLEWSPDGTALAIATSSGMQLLDSGLAPITTLYPNEVIYDVSWRPQSGQLAITRGNNLEIASWNPTTSTVTPVSTVTGANTQLAVAWKNDGTRIATFEALLLPPDSRQIFDVWYGSIRFWSTNPWQSQTLSTRIFMFFSPEDYKLIPDVMSWHPVENNVMVMSAPVIQSNDNRLLLDGVRTIYFVNGSTGLIEQRIPAITQNSWPFAFAWSPTSDTFAFADDFSVMIRDGQTGTILSNAIQAQVVSVDWNLNGRYLALGGYIWDNTTQQLLGYLGTTYGEVLLDWHPIGNRIAIAEYTSNGVTVRIEDPSILPGYQPVETPTPFFTSTPTPPP